VGFAGFRNLDSDDGLEFGYLRTGHVALVLELDGIHLDNLRAGNFVLVDLFDLGAQTDGNHDHAYLDFRPFFGRFATAVRFNDFDRKCHGDLEGFDFRGRTSVLFEFRRRHLDQFLAGYAGRLELFAFLAGKSDSYEEVLVKMSSSELEEYGCSSAEIKTFKVAVAFSIEIVESNGCSKPAEKWTEIEVCMVMISIGLGTKVEKIDQHEITGAKVIKMDTIKLQNKCNMTGTQVTKFKAVVGIKVTETGKSHTGGGKPNKGSPCSSRSSSPDSHCSRGSKGSHGSHHGKHGKAVKVTKTTVTKTTHYSKH
jgi:hypothetical protein